MLWNKISVRSSKELASGMDANIKLTVRQSKTKMVEFVTLKGWIFDDFSETVIPLITK